MRILYEISCLGAAKVCQREDLLNATIWPQTQTDLPDETIMLNCTVELPLSYAECDIAFHWFKAGNLLTNDTPGYEISDWSQRWVCTVLHELIEGG